MKKTDLHERFCWYEQSQHNGRGQDPQERYKDIVDWASRARGINPTAFDELTAWILEGESWSDEEIVENGKYLRDKVLGRFLEQNRLLREQLTALEPSGLVNTAVFGTLDYFDRELSGDTMADMQKEAVEAVFHDFSRIRDRKIRECFAGGITGPSGTNSVEMFGYINILKECDASVQWTLFMPDMVRSQQNGFQVEHFEYLKFPGLRFIGMEKDFEADPEALKQLQRTLDSMSEYHSGFDSDAILLHHFGRGVDVEPCHGLWGRFMMAGAPVPEGFTFVDFIPQSDGHSGVPYLSQFACARFAGDRDAMHSEAGFDCNAMYDVTRNIILGQNVIIPYPEKYWTAEVYQDGFGKDSTVYLFSVKL